jgi:nucleotidyltransferase substrate binding protein (TIGR01987 family)
MNRDDVVLSDFAKAGERLAEALSQPETDVLRDACIQRFEFCFELAWKSVQAVGRAYGHECSSPRVAFGIALRNGWIGDEVPWLDMLTARNQTTHTYRETLAQSVYAELPGFLRHLLELSQTLRERLDETR